MRAVCASTHYNAHRFEAARALLEQALEPLRAHADREGEALATVSLGVVALALDETSTAFALLDEGRALAGRLGLARWEAMALSYLAMIRHLGGDVARAALVYDESINALAALGVRRAEGLALFGRAMLRLETHALDGASDDLRDALANERVTSPDYEPLLAAALALIAAARDDVEARDHHLAFATRCVAQRGARFAREVAALEEALRRGDHGPLAACVTPEARLLRRGTAALAGYRAIPTLTVAEDRRWFSVGDGERQDIARRKALRLILGRLVDQHRASPGDGLDVEALIRAGWPGQRVLSAAGAARVYTAIATLRRLGLADLLERRGEGYALHPRTRVVAVP
ncbi:MAG: hypothetical protein H6745_30635 [Deltaproteobacteria bacterium]|nr:hypothetical protein [Deltaproteobacteria bacterium]